MSFFKNFDWSFKSIAKIAGIAVLGVAALAVVIALISFAIRNFTNTTFDQEESARGYFGGDGASYSYAEMDMAMDEAGYNKQSLPISPSIPQSTGNDAEEYEVKSYNGSISTRHLEEICRKFEDLKSRPEVIFENSDKSDHSCYYYFKVEKEWDQEIVDLIESLKPDYFNANIQSIKGSVEYVESELEILSKKLASVEETLENAQTAYDEISLIATRQQDAESLATIIDSKLNLIERLTSERLSIKERIDRYNQQKADQTDRLNYTFFSISINNDVLFDWKQIKENWKYEGKELIRNINDVFQGVTLDLVYYLFAFAQAVLYLFLSVFLLKWVWKGVKWIWRGKKTKKT